MSYIETNKQRKNLHSLFFNDISLWDLGNHRSPDSIFHLQIAMASWER